MTADLRALIVSYAFPPVGGAGVQRVLKLVKYLPSHCVTPAVLTAHNPSVPLWDRSLERSIPADIDISRTFTFEPTYATKRLAWGAAASKIPNFLTHAKKRLVWIGRQLLVPDPQVLWLPSAGMALGRRLARGADDVVFISGPPFSQFLLAGLARIHPRTAMVLDYRDEWTTTQAMREMGGSERASAWLEQAILRKAHAVTTATDAFRSELLARHPFLDPGHVHTVPNGYDPDDFPIAPPRPPEDRLVLTYVGTVFRLTSARGLLDAIRLLHAREPEIATLLEVRFIGRIVETEAAFFEGAAALGVRCLGYMDHDKALEQLAASHTVLCLLADVPGADRIYPAKIFEIMYLGRPCLALAPNGALAELVRKHALGVVIHPCDPERIFADLLGRLRAFRNGNIISAGQRVDIERFHRQRLAGDFALVFHSAVARARGRRVIQSSTLPMRAVRTRQLESP